MAIPSQQIGWSQKSKLLWYISKQLEKLTQVAGNVVVTPQITGGWSVTTGGAAGDGTIAQYSPTGFNITGPDDNVDNGWVYLKKYFPDGAVLSVDFQWASVDDGTDVDWPIYCIDATEPTGEPSDLTVRADGTPQQSTWDITVPPGSWFSVGIYSNDSCCGRGFLSVDISTSSLPYSVAQLAFAIPDDGAGVACSNASNPSLLSPIYWAPGVGIEANVTFLYYDTALTNPVVSGYYSDGTTYYAVNIYGLVQVIGSCV